MDLDGKGTLWSAFCALFDRNKDKYPARLKSLWHWQKENPDASIRVYETFAGYRAILTHKKYASDDESIKTLMKLTKTDKLYQMLCQTQGCYRARLTAKPWRMSIKQGTTIDPIIWNPLAENEARDEKELTWLNEYNVLSHCFAACKYLETWGSEFINKEINEVVKMHDKKSNAKKDLPLA